MIKIKTLKIQNFLSFGAIPTEVNLDTEGAILVLGENLDDTTNGTTSNGTGKSTIVNAMVYALYDKPISNISKENLVNNINKKNMLVSLTFEKDGKEYRIERTRKSKQGNQVFLYEGDKDITLDSMSNTNELLEQIIGIPYELFVRIVAFSATNMPFLDLPTKAQIELIEELFELKTLTERAEILKERIKETDTQMRIESARLEQLQAEEERHNRLLVTAEQRAEQWELEHGKQIKVLEEKVDSLKTIDIEEQKTLLEEYNTLKTQLQADGQLLKVVEKEITQYRTVVKQKQGELVHLRDAKCPYCLQEYKDTKAKIKECEDTIKQSVEEVEKLDVQQKTLDEKVNDAYEKYENIQKSLVIKNVQQLVDMEKDISKYETKLSELVDATNPYTEPLKELQDVKLEKISMEKMNELQTKSDHQKFLLKLLTKKDSFVRKALLNRNISFLNQRLRGYLADLGLPHVVEFTQEMAASISHFGRSLDFGNLSNGQRSRVNIALSLAFRDVLQSKHEHVNVCMFDEVLDVGLDGVGVQAAARLLKRKAKDEKLSLYVISHREEIDSMFEQKMIVQMINGFSNIVYK